MKVIVSYGSQLSIFGFRQLDNKENKTSEDLELSEQY